jgi:hypothetical protein
MTGRHPVFANAVIDRAFHETAPSLPQLYLLFPRMRSPRKSILVLEASVSGPVIIVIATTTVMKEALVIMSSLIQPL